MQRRLTKIQNLFWKAGAALEGALDEIAELHTDKNTEFLEKHPKLDRIVDEMRDLALEFDAGIHYIEGHSGEYLHLHLPDD